MGNATGIINTTDNNIYLSYISTNKYLDAISKKIKEFEFNIINSEILLNSLPKSNTEEINKILELILNNSSFILIAVSEDTIKSYSQNIELNALLNTNKKVIYLMTDNQFTPENIPWLNVLINNNKWYPLYDEVTLQTFLQELDSILKK